MNSLSYIDEDDKETELLLHYSLGARVAQIHQTITFFPLETFLPTKFKQHLLNVQDVNRTEREEPGLEK